MAAAVAATTPPNDEKRVDDMTAEELSAHAKAKAKAGDMESALHFFRRATVLQPDVPGHLSNQGAALMHLKRPEEAMQCFESALELDPANAMVRKQVEKYRKRAHQ